MKRIFIAIFVLVLALTFFVGQRKYTINKPYQFPEVNFLSARKMKESIEKCTVPQDIIDKMTTSTLLENYLSYPYNSALMIQSSPNISRSFNYLVTEHHFGLAELMARKDMRKVVLDRYLQADPSPNCTREIDEEIAKMDREVYGDLCKIEDQVLEDIRRLEILIAQLDLKENSKIDRMILREVQRKEYLKRLNWDTFYSSAGMYSMIKQQQENKRYVTVYY